jgi:hypothetical protein
MQEGTPPPKWNKHTTQSVYVDQLHHYSKSIPMVWDPKTKVVLPQFHVMFGDNCDTVQPPDPNIKLTNTMNRIFKTENYKYDDPFGNEYTYIFSYGEVDILLYNPSPDIKTCQESITTASSSDKTDSITADTSSSEKLTNNRSIFSMNGLRILHANDIFPQNNKDDFKAIKTYMELTCKYTQFQNHQRSMIWDYLTSMKRNSNSSPWNTKP